jgi:hypothetical protein
VNLVRRRLAQLGALSASLPPAVRTHAVSQRQVPSVELPSALARDTLLAARPTDALAHEWQIELPDQAVRLRPFVDIGRERYSLYQDTCETRAVGSAA